jgi:hypothetical protein
MSEIPLQTLRAAPYLISTDLPEAVGTRARDRNDPGGRARRGRRSSRHRLDLFHRSRKASATACRAVYGAAAEDMEATACQRLQ